jgi:hypothetical protein
MGLNAEMLSFLLSAKPDGQHVEYGILTSINNNFPVLKM